MQKTMNGGEIIACVAIVFGCGSAVAMSITRRVFGDGRTAKAQAALRVSEERNHMLELQLAEYRRESESLHKQLEWHSKLLSAQDNLVKQLGPAPAGNGSLPVNAPTASASEPARSS